jgi:hypothetical protein
MRPEQATEEVSDWDINAVGSVKSLYYVTELDVLAVMGYLRANQATIRLGVNFVSTMKNYVKLFRIWRLVIMVQWMR